jgi:hypothetical protein
VRDPYPPFDQIAPPGTRPQTPAKQGFSHARPIRVAPPCEAKRPVADPLLNPFLAHPAQPPVSERGIQIWQTARLSWDGETGDDPRCENKRIGGGAWNTSSRHAIMVHMHGRRTMTSQGEVTCRHGTETYRRKRFE